MKSSTYDKNTLTSIHRMPSNVGSQAHSEENLSRNARVDPKFDKSSTNDDTLRGIQMPSSSRHLNGGTRVRLSHHNKVPGASLVYRIALMCIVLATMCTATSVQKLMEKLQSQGVGGSPAKGRPHQPRRSATGSRRSTVWPPKRPDPNTSQRGRPTSGSSQSGGISSRVSHFNKFNAASAQKTLTPKKTTTGTGWSRHKQRMQAKIARSALNGCTVGGTLVEPHKLAIGERVVFELEKTKHYGVIITEIIDSDVNDLYKFEFIRQNLFDEAKATNEQDEVKVAELKRVLTEAASTPQPINKFLVETDDLAKIKELKQHKVNSEAMMSEDQQRAAKRAAAKGHGGRPSRRARAKAQEQLDALDIINKDGADTDQKENGVSKPVTREVRETAFSSLYERFVDNAFMTKPKKPLVEFINDPDKFRKTFAAVIVLDQPQFKSPKNMPPFVHPTEEAMANYHTGEEPYKLIVNDGSGYYCSITRINKDGTYDIKIDNDDAGTQRGLELKDFLIPNLARKAHYDNAKAQIAHLLQYAEEKTECIGFQMSGDLDARNVTQIINHFRNNPRSTIQYLNLNGNTLRDRNKKLLAEMLVTNKTLKKVWIEDSPFTEADAAIFAKILERNETLIDLIYKGNDVKTNTNNGYLMNKFLNRNKEAYRKLQYKEERKRKEELDQIGLEGLPSLPVWNQRVLYKFSDRGGLSTYDNAMWWKVANWRDQKLALGYPIKYLAMVVGDRNDRFTAEELMELPSPGQNDYFRPVLCITNMLGFTNGDWNKTMEDMIWGDKKKDPTKKFNTSQGERNKLMNDYNEAIGYAFEQHLPRAYTDDAKPVFEKGYVLELYFDKYHEAGLAEDCYFYTKPKYAEGDQVVFEGDESSSDTIWKIQRVFEDLGEVILKDNNGNTHSESISNIKKPIPKDHSATVTVEEVNDTCIIVKFDYDGDYKEDECDWTEIPTTIQTEYLEVVKRRTEAKAGGDSATSRDPDAAGGVATPTEL